MDKPDNSMARHMWTAWARSSLLAALIIIVVLLLLLLLLLLLSINNHLFLPSCSNLTFQTWFAKGITKFKDLYNQGILCPFLRNLTYLIPIYSFFFSK